MAKLTAQFELRDKMSKKLRTIRGEVKKLERARARVNQPVTMVMKTKDQATKTLRKLRTFLSKKMAKTHLIAIKVEDEATKSLIAISNFFKRRMPRTHALFIEVEDRASLILVNIATNLPYGQAITITAIDAASQQLNRIKAEIPQVQTITIRAIDMTTHVLQSVKGALLSIPKMIPLNAMVHPVQTVKMNSAIGAGENHPFLNQKGSVLEKNEEVKTMSLPEKSNPIKEFMLEWWTETIDEFVGDAKSFIKTKSVEWIRGLFDNLWGGEQDDSDSTNQSGNNGLVNCCCCLGLRRRAPRREGETEGNPPPGPGDRRNDDRDSRRRSFKIPKGVFTKGIPLVAAALGVLALATSEKEEMPSTVGSLAGGLAGAATGAAIGSVAGPIGATIGGLAGGILGSIGGSAAGDWLSDHWDSIKQGASEVGQWIESTFTKVKDTIFQTVFSLEWWGEKWDFVKGWTSEKWASAVEIWESIKTSFAETVFNPEWWYGHWELVKLWASEKWASAIEIWESIKTNLSETIFNGEWWLGQWDVVKAWTQEKWDSAVSIWSDVIGSIEQTLFSKEWWLGKWAEVVEMGKTKLKDLLDLSSKLWEFVSTPFSIGREKGKKAAKYATGGYITKPTLSWIGEAGHEYVIPTQNNRGRGRMLLARAAHDLDMHVSASRSTVSAEQVTAASLTGNHGLSVSGNSRDIIVQINGDHYYTEDADFEKFGQIAVEAVKKALQNDYFEGGEMMVYE